MALQFYFDTHIAKAAADQLRSKNIDVVRCEEVGMAAHLMKNICNTQQKKDASWYRKMLIFLILDAKWKQENRPHTGIMYEPNHLQGNAQISHIVKKLQFYNEAEESAAIDYQTEIVNRVIYL